MRYQIYEGRREVGLPVEKKNNIFAKGGYTDKEAERNILSMKGKALFLRKKQRQKNSIQKAMEETLRKLVFF